MSIRPRPLGAIVAASGLLAAACGGGDPGGLTSSAPEATSAVESPDAAPAASPTDDDVPEADSPRGAEPIDESLVLGVRARSLVGSHEIGIPDRFHELRIVEHDGKVWLAALYEASVLIGRVDQPVGEWHRIDQPPYRSVEMLSTPDGLVVVVGHDGEPASAWIRRDGDVWEGSSLGVRFLPSDLTTVDGRLWLAGRGSVSGVSGMYPRLLLSDDGVSWTDAGATLDVGMSQDELMHRALTSVVAQGERVLAVLTAPNTFAGITTVVESTDGGATWVDAALPGVAPSSMVAADGAVYGFNAFADPKSPPILIAELDLAAGWLPLDADLYVGREGSSAVVSVGSDPMVIAFAPWVDCAFDDGASSLCTQGRPWFGTGFEAGSVGRIEVADPEVGRSPLVLVTSDGRIVTVVPGASGLVVEIHDGALVEQVPPYIEQGADMEVGTTYRYRLDTHCGWGHLGSFNGVAWLLDGAAVGEPPRNSHDAESFWADITLVDEGHIDLDADGVLNARYVPGVLDVGCE